MRELAPAQTLPYSLSGSYVRLPVLALVAMACQLSPAAAHRLKVFATVVGTSVEGKAYFVGGGPAENVSATLRDLNEKVVAEGRTDTEGRFALTAPVRSDLVVVVDAMDGHVARFAIAAARLPSNLPAGEAGEATPARPPAGEKIALAVPAMSADADEIASSVARQIEPLAEQIDAMESAIRLRDVLGGLGYIVGIFGLIAFFKARRRTGGGQA